MATAAVVWNLAQPPKEQAAPVPVSQSNTIRLASFEMSPAATPYSPQSQVNPANRDYPQTAAPRLQPVDHPQQDRLVSTPSPAEFGQTFGQPGIGYAGDPDKTEPMQYEAKYAPVHREPRDAGPSTGSLARTPPTTSAQTFGQPGIGYAGDPAKTEPIQYEPKYVRSFEQAAGQPVPIQLATGVRLVEGYNNTIAPDEDLLQGAGIGAPSTSDAPPIQTPATTPAIPAPAAAPTTPSADLRPAIPEPAAPPVSTGSQSDPLSESTRPISRTPPVNEPLKPAVPSMNQPAQPDPRSPSANQFWSKNTPPAPDEDLLQGEVGDLPAPSDANRADPLPGTADGTPSTAPKTAAPQTAPTQNKAPFTTSPGMPHSKPLPRPPTVSPDEPYVDPHLELYSENCFPSAKKCKACHEEVYEEWAGSSHAYASISPMFQKFEQTIHALAMGTISHFCMRCHAPVATALAHPREGSIWDSVPAAREGVTCIACHRVNENYGKVNGERRIEMGDIHQPMYGAGYGQKLKEVIDLKSTYKVKTGPGEKGPGQDIHTKVIHFEQISDSSFCVSCHQVAVAPGIALEVVWAQYRASPACKQGITCQECHMGQEPGVAAGYATGPVAVINGKEVDPFRKHSNHMFYGPGYSIAHPGLFPHNEKAEEWKMQEWLQFDYRKGWGTEEFEKLVDDEKIKVTFPAAWDNADDRADAREIVDANLEKLEAKRRMRHRLMENGSHLEGPIFEKQPMAGRRLKFHYDVTNTNPGHNMPSGSLGAQPQVWLNVVLTGPNGEHLWESGYVDRNGDMADLHSLEVAAGRIRRDFQLFNLQTKFLITGIKGTDREMYLPVNTDFDQLPFIRASGFPVTVMNHPPFIRMEAHSVPPLGTMKAKYHVPAKLMQQPGVYRLSVRMRSRAEPIYFMRFCKATPEMERNMNYWMLDYHEESYRFMVQ